MEFTSLFTLIKGFQPTVTLNNGQVLAQAKKALVLAKITSFALEQFAQKRIGSNFDPLVGETACQLRALKCLLLLACSEGLQREIAETILLAKQVFHSLEGSVQKGAKKGAPKQTLLEVCGGSKRDLRMSSDLRFLVESCFLTKCKKTLSESSAFYAYKDRLDMKTFRNFLKDEQGISDFCLPGVGKSGLDQLAKYAQSDLAESSITFIQEVSKLSRELTQRVLRDAIGLDNFKRKCAPCFYTMEALISKVLAENQRLLIEVKLGTTTMNPVGKVQMLFGPNVAHADFEQVDSSRLGSAIVIEGYTVDEQLVEDSRKEYMTKFIKTSLKDALLCNAASHPQFPGEVAAELPDDPRLEAYKLRAEREGFCEANPSFFVIDHISCATLEEVASDE